MLKTFFVISSIEQNPTHIYVDTGNFTVTLVVTSNGIKYSATPQIINVSAHPIVGFKIDSTQIYYSTYSRVFIDTSTLYKPVSSYTWSFGDNTAPISSDSASIMHKYNTNGVYGVQLKVTDIKGCADSTISNVSISDRFYIPNVFTPNGDSQNDQFVVTSNGVTSFSIEIYSRWGNLVFRRDGYQQIVWNGRLPEGSLVKPGTYFYVINSENGDVAYEPEKGFITVFY